MAMKTTQERRLAVIHIALHGTVEERNAIRNEIFALPYEDRSRISMLNFAARKEAEAAETGLNFIGAAA